MSFRTSVDRWGPSRLQAANWLLIVASVLTAISVLAASGNSDAGLQRNAAAAMPDRIWRDSGDVGSLNMVNGSGGLAQKPNANGSFAFVSEDESASSPKFDVTDARGVLWKVKLGDESQAETAATRFLWAAGYLTDDDYYLPAVTVTGLPALRRGKNQISEGGVVHGARLERVRAAGAKQGHWDWFENPFVGTRQFNGLRIMMSLLNSWDLKDVNNAIYVVQGERHYIVSDLGSTFGKTGGAWTRTKGKPGDYDDAKFIAKVTPDLIDFVLFSRPNVLGAIDPVNYRERTDMEKITKQIPLADVRWLGARLSRLGARQVRDAFRGAGFGADDVEALTTTFRRRIAALKAL
jgi:hypothetical protein